MLIQIAYLKSQIANRYSEIINCISKIEIRKSQTQIRNQKNMTLLPTKHIDTFRFSTLSYTSLLNSGRLTILTMFPN